MRRQVLDRIEQGAFHRVGAVAVRQGDRAHVPAGPLGSVPIADPLRLTDTCYVLIAQSFRRTKGNVLEVFIVRGSRLTATPSPAGQALLYRCDRVRRAFVPRRIPGDNVIPVASSAPPMPSFPT